MDVFTSKDFLKSHLKVNAFWSRIAVLVGQSKASGEQVPFQYFSEVSSFYIVDLNRILMKYWEVNMYICKEPSRSDPVMGSNLPNHFSTRLKMHN